MYREFFQLKRMPFGIAPDPDFLYLSPNHNEALAHLLYGIDQRKGLMVLTGEVGCGKTTLLQTLERRLRERNFSIVNIPNPMVTERELLSAILDELEVSKRSESPIEMMKQIQRALQQAEREGHEIVLTIDEAQGLSIEMLELIRLLSNLETTDHKALQIILLGQPELRKTLRKKTLRQFRQRILVYYDLKPMSFFEMVRYICFRLQAAGAKGHIRFSLRALMALYNASNGIPRLINTLCDRALLSAFSRNSKKISHKDMRRAIKDLGRL